MLNESDDEFGGPPSLETVSASSVDDDDDDKASLSTESSTGCTDMPELQ